MDPGFRLERGVPAYRTLQDLELKDNQDKLDRTRKPKMQVTDEIMEGILELDDKLPKHLQPRLILPDDSRRFLPPASEERLSVPLDKYLQGTVKFGFTESRSKLFKGETAGSFAHAIMQKTLIQKNERFVARLQMPRNQHAKHGDGIRAGQFAVPARTGSSTSGPTALRHNQSAAVILGDGANEAVTLRPATQSKLMQSLRQDLPVRQSALEGQVKKLKLTERDRYEEANPVQRKLKAKEKVMGVVEVKTGGTHTRARFSGEDLPDPKPPPSKVKALSPGLRRPRRARPTPYMTYSAAEEPWNPITEKYQQKY